MNIKEVLYYLTDNELDQLQEYLIKAQGLFVTALPFLTEREILLQSEEYFHLAIEIRRVFHPKRN